MRGDYAVDGVGDLIRSVNVHYPGFIMMFAYLLNGSLLAPEERAVWLRTAKGT